jgi:hypothetical protein
VTGPANPFDRVLDGGGYLDLLHLGPAADRTVGLIATALAEPGAVAAYTGFMSQSGWRPHLVGAVAALLDNENRLDRIQLWNAVDAGSWVTPQLVVAAMFSDPMFAERARHRIELRCPVQSAPATLQSARRAAASVQDGWLSQGLSWLASRLFRPATREVDSLVRHVVDGPGTDVTRSGKLMASLLGVCHRVPALAAQEPAWRSDPDVAAVLAQDFDYSDRLTLGWMGSAEKLFQQRGTPLHAPSA